VEKCFQSLTITCSIDLKRKGLKRVMVNRKDVYIIFTMTLSFLRSCLTTKEERMKRRYKVALIKLCFTKIKLN
jgi:hypothetical protein